MSPEQKTFVDYFYRENFKKIYAYAYAILRNCSEAEVAVQEAFLVACKKPNEFMNTPSPMGWIKKVVAHMALHILRKNR